MIKNRRVGWRPLAFLEKKEATTEYRVQDADGKEHVVRLTPNAIAAWIADEPDEHGRPIITLFADNRMDVS